MQRLRAATHRRHRLQRDAHHVVERLLRGERGTARLRVESQLQTSLSAGSEAFAHHLCPECPRSAELRDLFKEIVADVEEEAESGCDVLDVEPRIDRRLY